jgi:hypothetical protein
MLTPGNKKLGAHLIWSFGLPSGQADVCVGMTPTCRRVCYSVRTEQYRLRAARQYERNLKLTHRRGFVRRVRAFLIAHHVRVVRIHTGGEFYSARYARKWLRIIRRSPRVRFFTYSRAWRLPAIRDVLEAMAALPNCQVWFSLDRDTGRPDTVPANVRVAWLMVTSEDRPSSPVNLIFRVQALRRQPLLHVNGMTVCRAETGIPSDKPVTCDHCRLCWRPPVPDSSPGRIPLVLASM